MASAASTAKSVLKHPLCWVPTLYLAMGLPNATVSQASKVMYKNLGVSNADIATYTAYLYLPWVLKPLWSPFMEPYFTKRKWVLGTEFVMGVAICLMPLLLPLPGMFKLTLAFSWLVAFASGTQDIAADTVFMNSLSSKDQAKYNGVQGIGWNGGSILASGVGVWLTGMLHDGYGYDWVKAWSVVLVGLGVVLLGLGFWHLFTLPDNEPERTQEKGAKAAVEALVDSWVTFFQKPQIWMMLLVVFMYRFGEGFIENFGPLFLLDPRDAGGLGFSNQQIGTIYNTYGTIGFLVGAILGGFFSSKFTLRRSFFFMAIALNFPHVTYYYLSHAQPDNMTLVASAVTFEKFGFGFGSVAHMLYMMQQVAPGKYRMTHYAFATGIMAFTKMITGPLSSHVYGWVQQDYKDFFLVVLLCSIPPIIIAKFAPFPFRDDDSASARAGH